MLATGLLAQKLTEFYRRVQIVYHIDRLLQSKRSTEHTRTLYSFAPASQIIQLAALLLSPSFHEQVVAEGCCHS